MKKILILTILIVGCNELQEGPTTAEKDKVFVEAMQEIENARFLLHQINVLTIAGEDTDSLKNVFLIKRKRIDSLAAKHKALIKRTGG